MKILNCSLPLSNFKRETLVLAALVLIPFGSVNELLKKDTIWHGFEDQAPVLWVVQLHLIDAKNCKAWGQAVLSETQRQGTLLNGAVENPESWTQAWKEWDAWNPDEVEAVTECKDFPCDIKLNAQEVSQMEKAPEARRFKKFQDLVIQRAVQYKKDQKRKEYEFPGDPKDPWELFEKKGYVSTLQRPKESQFVLRKLEFSSNQINTIRQVLDRRVAMNGSYSTVTIWTRDAYTDHYFDSWGEWTHFQCEVGNKKNAFLVQALIIELDELKKKNVIAQMLRGKMKSAIEQNGSKYLDQIYDRILIKATSN